MTHTKRPAAHGRDELSAATDAELIVASTDDPRAFREPYDRWADPLLAFLYRRVLDAEVAADLLAESFAIAYEKRGRYRDTGPPGAAWLYGIARNVVLLPQAPRAVEDRPAARPGGKP
jgi:Sigma-70 region 2